MRLRQMSVVVVMERERETHSSWTRVLESGAWMKSGDGGGAARRSISLRSIERYPVSRLRYGGEEQPGNPEFNETKRAHHLPACNPQ
jgi:hypothetical protein